MLPDEKRSFCAVCGQDCGTFVEGAVVSHWGCAFADMEETRNAIKTERKNRSNTQVSLSVARSGLDNS
jgi:hypothetical protein